MGSAGANCAPLSSQTQPQHLVLQLTWPYVQSLCLEPMLPPACMAQQRRTCPWHTRVIWASATAWQAKRKGSWSPADAASAAGSLWYHQCQENHILLILFLGVVWWWLNMGYFIWPGDTHMKGPNCAMIEVHLAQALLLEHLKVQVWNSIKKS